MVVCYVTKKASSSQMPVLCSYGWLKALPQPSLGLPSGPRVFIIHSILKIILSGSIGYRDEFLYRKRISLRKRHSSIGRLHLDTKTWEKLQGWISRTLGVM